jgi:hypothetical protein
MLLLTADREGTMTTLRTLTGVALAVALLGAPAAPASAQARNEIPADVGDLATAQLVEIRDRAGAVLLHGTFKTSENSPREIERKVDLVSPSGQKTKGKVAIEIKRRDGRVEDEVVLALERMPAMTDCEVFVDGKFAGAFVTSKSGNGEVRLKRK